MYCWNCVYLMFSDRLPWHHSIWLSLVTIWGHLLKKLVCLITFLAHEFSSRGRVNYHLSFWIQFIVEELDFQSSRKSVMWDFPEQSFIPFPSFIDAFIFKLSEGCEITSEFFRFRWREVLHEELIRHLIPCCLVILGKELNHIFVLSFKEKGKSFSFITFGDTPFCLLCVTYL